MIGDGSSISNDVANVFPNEILHHLFVLILFLFFLLLLCVLKKGLGVTLGEQSGGGASIWLAPSNPTVAVFANQSYFVSCKAPGAEKIVWTKVGDGDITPTSGK
jgi:hypothetical protein